MLTTKQIMAGYTVTFRKTDGTAFYFLNGESLSIEEEHKLINDAKLEKEKTSNTKNEWEKLLEEKEKKMNCFK